MIKFLLNHTLNRPPLNHTPIKQLSISSIITTNATTTNNRTPTLTFPHNPPNKVSPITTRHLTTTPSPPKPPLSIDPKLSARLTSLGHTSPHLQSAVQRTLLKSLTKSEILNFPDAGLSAMVDSLQSQGLDLSSPPVDITVNVPHHDYEFTVSGSVNMSILDVSKDDVVLGEYITGTCGGTMSCSTCHVYIDDPAQYKDSLGEDGEVDEAEIDMLDLAKGYKEGVSRLGCQVKVGEGLRITVPEEVTDYWT